MSKASHVVKFIRVTSKVLPLECPDFEDPCWLTIAVTAPAYFDSGI